MHRFFRTILTAAFVALLPGTAAAFSLAVDLELASPRDHRLDDDALVGAGVRLGVGLPIPVLDVVPEVGISYANLGGGQLDGFLFDVHTARVLAGARVGVPIGYFRPAVYGHVGYGFVLAGLKLVAADKGVQPALDDDSAFTWDAGLALDFTLIPLIDLGIHAGYNVVKIEEPLEWINAGIHAGLRF